MSNITLNMIVKNESSSIFKTLNSVKDCCDIITILDTGSTDDTKEKIKYFCTENQIKLYLKDGVFKDFQQARNDALKFAESFEDVNGFILILDANDELKEGGRLRTLINSGNLTKSGYSVNQKWMSGKEVESYWNTKLIKSRDGWYWWGRVHEALLNDKNERVDKLEASVRIFQNRNENCESSLKRLKRDAEVLKEDYIPFDEEKKYTEIELVKIARTIYYLARTLYGLMSIEEDEDKKKEYMEESFRYFKERNKIAIHPEELYTSLEHCGDISLLIKKPSSETILYYLQCLELQTRVEPLLKISLIYYDFKSYFLFYLFISMCCRLAEPKNQTFSYNVKMHEYTRWYLHSIACLILGKNDMNLFKAGLDSMDICEKYAYMTDLDKQDYNKLKEEYKNVCSVLTGELKTDSRYKNWLPEKVE